MNTFKVERLKKGLTQEELAKMVGISRQSLSAIENGKYKPRIKTLVDIMKALGEEIPWYLQLCDRDSDIYCKQEGDKQK